MGGILTAGADGGVVVPDSGSLLAGGSSSASSSSSKTDGKSGFEAAVEELQRVMRGQDPSQLRTLVGLPAAAAATEAAAHGAGSSSSSSSLAGDAVAEAAEVQAAAEAAAAEMMGGLRQYEPESGELVVLLSARISGKPALGAELLVVAQREDGSWALELPDGWQEALAMA